MRIERVDHDSAVLNLHTGLISNSYLRICRATRLSNCHASLIWAYGFHTAPHTPSLPRRVFPLYTAPIYAPFPNISRRTPPIRLSCLHRRVAAHTSRFPRAGRPPILSTALPGARASCRVVLSGTPRYDHTIAAVASHPQLGSGSLAFIQFFGAVLRFRVWWRMWLLFAVCIASGRAPQMGGVGDDDRLVNRAASVCTPPSFVGGHCK